MVYSHIPALLQVCTLFKKDSFIYLFESQSYRESEMEDLTK